MLLKWTKDDKQSNWHCVSMESCLRIQCGAHWMVHLLMIFIHSIMALLIVQSFIVTVCVLPKLTKRNEIKVELHNIVSIKIEIINSQFGSWLFLLNSKENYVKLEGHRILFSGITFKFVKICTMNDLEWHEYIYVCSEITSKWMRISLCGCLCYCCY